MMAQVAPHSRPNTHQQDGSSDALYREKTLRRVRVLFNGEYVVDTVNAQLVWERPNYPTYFFEDKDLAQKYLHRGSRSTLYDIVVGERKAAGAVQKFNQDKNHGVSHDYPELEGLLKINFAAMDAWFEEDEQIFVHPKDPYKRVDVLQSSRHVRVEVDGVQIAETTKPRLLFETSLPIRYYIPKVDFKMDLLVPSETTTQCPYKGIASYYSVRLPSGKLKRDVVWWYRTPQAECIEIKGLCCVWSEMVDVWVDGVKV